MSTKRGQQAAWVLYVSACRAIGVDEYPVAVGPLEAMAAAMMYAGYIAIEGYLGHVMTMDTLAGNNISCHVQRCMKHLRRGCAPM